MSINSVQENKNKFIATTISLIVFSLFIVCLFLYSFIIPSKEENLNSIETSSISEFQKVSGTIELENSLSEKHQLNSTEAKSKFSSEKTEQISQKNSAELLRDNFIASRGKQVNTSELSTENSKGTSLNETSGNDPHGTLTNNEKTHGIGINLTGRTVVLSPILEKDTKESGKIVIDITVDKKGNVIKADPNGRGTTTNSPSLKQKAKQAALSTKFNESIIEEQKGTITIIFSF